MNFKNMSWFNLRDTSRTQGNQTDYLHPRELVNIIISVMSYSNTQLQVQYAELKAEHHKSRCSILYAPEFKI
jgi:hypothetical protein